MSIAPQVEATSDDEKVEESHVKERANDVEMAPEEYGGTTGFADGLRRPTKSDYSMPPQEDLDRLMSMLSIGRFLSREANGTARQPDKKRRS